MALAILLVYLAAVLGLTGVGFDAQAVLIAAVLVIISLPMLAREAARQEDRRLFWLLVLALSFRLLASLARHYVAFSVYGGGVDAVGYHNAGIDLAAQFRAGDFGIEGYRSLDGTNAVNIITGIVYSIIGSSSRISGFMVFSWLAFWGSFFFYKAFTIAVPEGHSRQYAYLVFFVPSILFWPSGLGKDAWMFFTLGIAAFGAARLLTDRVWTGLPLAVLGLGLGAWVRPHVASLLGIALAIAYLIPRARGVGARRAPAARLAGVAVVVILAALLLIRTQEFLGRSNLLSASGVVSELEEVAERSNSGGSEFTPAVVRSPAELPRAFFTVLFRPLPIEAGNAQALAASIESLMLLLFVLVRWKWVVAALRSIRRQPYVALAFAYVGMFVIAFSSFPNFGLLARERVQLLPLFFVVLCVIPRRTPAGLEEGHGRRDRSRVTTAPS